MAALDTLWKGSVGCEAVNLGTGRGVSVLQLVRGMERATGKRIPFKIAPRRKGDVASLYADVSKAERLLQWKAHLGVDQMCEDTWRWQVTNPYGYRMVNDESELFR